MSASQVRRHSTVPDEGAALSGIARPAKGRGNTAWSTEGAKPYSDRSSLLGDVVSNRHGGAPGRRACPAQGRAGCLAKVPQETCAVSALRSLTCGEGKEKREALAPRLLGRGR